MSLEKYLSSPSRNSIEDLAQIVTSGELSDALRLYNEVKRESERAAAMVMPSTSNIPVHHEETVVEPKSNTSNTQNVCLYNFSCSLCNEIFENQDDLISHNCLHDPNVNVMYECQECRTLFQSLDALAQHMKIHEENVLVIRSSKVNKSKKSQNINNEKDRIGYVCPICDKVLSSKGSVIKHQELHKGLKPYLCSYCGKSFSIKGNKDKHEQIHIGEKPYKCSICEKSFTLKGNLKKHILTHTAFKQYKCPLCEKDFSLKGNLDKHLKRHERGYKPRPVKYTKVPVDMDEHAEITEMEQEQNENEAQAKPTPTGMKITIIENRGNVKKVVDPKEYGPIQDSDMAESSKDDLAKIKEMNEGGKVKQDVEFKVEEGEVVEIIHTGPVMAKNSKDDIAKTKVINVDGKVKQNVEYKVEGETVIEIIHTGPVREPPEEVSEHCEKNTNESISGAADHISEESTDIAQT